MTITRALTIKIDLPHAGRYQFPDIQSLRGKKIISIVPVVGLYSEKEAGDMPLFALPPYTARPNSRLTTSTTQLQNIYINLTPDGQNYTHQNISAFTLSNAFTRGLYTRIDAQLSIPDCYIDYTATAETIEDYGSALQLVIFYEDRYYANPATNINSEYTSFSVALDNIEKDINQIALPENLQLVGKRYRSLEVTFPAMTPQNIPGAPSILMLNTYITLVAGTTAIIENLPLIFLYQYEYYELLKFTNIDIDLVNSYLTIIINPNDTSIDPDTINKTSLVLTAEVEP